ncbi:5382_t:CDS:2, partial [Dentiscutata erythropus]
VITWYYLNQYRNINGQVVQNEIPNGHQVVQNEIPNGHQVVQNEKPNGHQVVQNEELTGQVVQVVQNKGPNDQVFQNEDNDEINRISVISRSPFGNVRTATWENSTVVFKSITINTSQIDSGIIDDIKNAVNDSNIVPIETTISELKNMRRSLADNQIDSNEKWIENKLIEGRINEYKMVEFEDYKLINNGASSKVYRARFKSTKNICALKIIGKNNHNNKEIKNELEHMLSVESHENIIKFYDATTLPSRIKDGLREEPIANTHHRYVAIYQRCWQGMQENRPSIGEVARVLKDIIVQDITADDNFDIFDITDFKEYIKTAFKSIAINFNPDITTVDPPDDMTHFIDNLYSTFSKLFNEGKPVSDIIINFISENDKTKEEVFQWLLENNTRNPKYICLFGLFYRWNIGTEHNKDTFNFFIDAAEQGNNIAQYFVGKCYEIGWDINKNTKKAIGWYAESAENNCAAAECVLGEYFYKFRKYTKAFYWLKRAAEHKNYKALNTLGLCYQRGQGTDTNEQILIIEFT